MITVVCTLKKEYSFDDRYWDEKSTEKQLVFTSRYYNKQYLSNPNNIVCLIRKDKPYNEEYK